MINNGPVYPGSKTWKNLANKPDVTLGDTGIASGTLDSTGVVDSYAYLDSLINNIGVTDTTIIVPRGTYLINSNLTFPNNIHLKFQKGAIISPSTTVGAGTFTNNADSADITGTVSTTSGSAVCTGVGTSFLTYRVGQYIIVDTAGSPERKKIRKINSATSLEVWGTFSNNASTKKAAMSSNILTCSEPHELGVGDYIYIGGVRYCVTTVPISTTVTVHIFPSAIFSTQVWTKDVKITINGSLRVGNYKCFAGLGSIRFGMGVVNQVKPEWWGAKASNNTVDATANANAFELAMWSGASGVEPPIVCSVGVYYIDRSIMFKPCAVIIGQGRSEDGTHGTTLRITGATNAHVIEDFPDYAKHQKGEITRLSIYGNIAVFNHGISICSSEELYISNCQFAQCYWGIYLSSPLTGNAAGGGTIVSNNHFGTLRNCIFWGISDSSLINNEMGFIATVADQTASGVYCRGGSLNLFSGNHIYADASTYSSSGIYFTESVGKYIVTGNSINACDYGINFGGSSGNVDILDNIIDEHRVAGIQIAANTIVGVNIKNNRISENAIGLNITTGCYLNNGIITGNNFYSNAGGHIVSANINLSGNYDYTLIEKNIGIDACPLLGTYIPILEASNTPKIFTSSIYKTESARTLTNLLYGSAGKVIKILIDHATTFTCTGTTFRNAGADVVAAAGDIVIATKGDRGVSPPTAPTVAQSATAGSVTAGTHKVKISYVTSLGETIPGSASLDVTVDGSHKVTVGGIAVGPAWVTAKRVYMTKTGGSGSYYYVADIAADATTYDIDVADAGLIVVAPIVDTTQAWYLQHIAK